MSGKKRRKPAQPATETVAAATRAWVSGAIAVGAALLVTVGVFAPTVGDEFTWDDHGLIRTNTHIQDAAHYAEALTTHYWNVSSPAAATNAIYDHLYRPVVTLAFIAQYRLFGPHAAGFRVVSLGLHLLCMALAWGWLRRRLPVVPGIAPTAIVALGLTLFAIHPSRAESVAWISGSTELWWCAWLLLGALALDAGRRWTAGGLLALALLSKETAIVAAPLLLADAYLRGRSVNRRDVAALGVPVAVALALRVAVVGLGPSGARLEGAPTRALASAGLYLRSVVSPFDPTIFAGLRTYTCEGGEQLDPVWLAWGALFVASLVGLGVLAAKRAPWRPALADALWLALPLLPVLNVIDIGGRNLVADRFLYVPLLGVAALVTRGLLAFHARRPPLAALVAGCLGLLVAALAVVTSLHGQVFASSSTLWEYELERDPSNPLVLHSVGTARIRAGLYASGYHLLTRSCEVSQPTCVQQDILQCGEDVAWALAWTTAADDPEGLDRLARAYAQVAVTGHLRLAPPGAPPIDVEVPEPARDQASYVYPLALVTARQGRLDEARRALEALARRGPLDPTTSELRTRLEAATGAIPEAPSAEPTSELPVVLPALAAALSDPAAEPRAALAAYALGFGPATPLPPDLGEANRAAMVALRALHTFEEIDGSMQASLSRADEPAYDALVQLARRREAARRLDAELAAIDARAIR